MNQAFGFVAAIKKKESHMTSRWNHLTSPHLDFRSFDFRGDIHRQLAAVWNAVS